MTMYGGAVFLVYRDEVLGSALAPLAVGTARIIELLLQHFGFEVLREGAILSQPEGFAYAIGYACTGFLPITTFWVCVLAYSGTAPRRWPGLIVGGISLWLVNVFRLVSLFYVGVYRPESFAFAHEFLWEVLLAIAFIGLWLTWIHRVEQSRIQVRLPSTPEP